MENSFDWKNADEINYKEVEEKQKKHCEEQRTELKKKSKPLEELVFEKEFEVISSRQLSFKTEMTPRSEVIFGGKSPKYQTGFTTFRHLEVKPLNVEDDIIRRIIFYGNSQIEAENKIIAYIPLFEKIEMPKFEAFGDSDILYIPRTPKKEEEAIRIIKLSDNGIKHLHIDDSVNCSIYLSQKKF